MATTYPQTTGGNLANQPGNPSTLSTDPLAAPDPATIELGMGAPPPQSVSELGPNAVEIPTSIPQSLAPPSTVSAFGENPWEVLERERQLAETIRRKDAQARLDEVALDPDSYFKGKDMTFAKDPERAKMLVMNSAFMAFASGDQPFPRRESDIQRRILRQDLALRLFGGRGKESEEAFHAEVVGAAQRRKDRAGLGRELAAAASLAAVMDNAGATTSGSQAFQKWQAEARQQPGYDPEDAAEYFEAWREIRNAEAAEMETYRPELDAVWKAFKERGDYGTAAETAYQSIDEEDRPKFLAALSRRAKALPETERRGFWANILKTSGQSIGGMITDAGTGGTDAMLRGGTVGWENFLGSDNRAVEQRKRDDLERFRGFRKQANFKAEVIALQQETYDPLKYLAADGTWSQRLEKIAYGTPGVFASSAMAMAAPPAMFVSLQESHYQTLRQRMLETGKDEAEADSIATGLAPVAAGIELFSERLGAKLLLGRLPLFEKALGKTLDGITTATGRFGARAGVAWLEEGTQEVGQNYIDPLVQSLGAALSRDVPGVQWLGKGGEFDGDWSDNLDTFLAVGPLAIFGAAVGGFTKERRAAAFKNASPRELQALGARDEDIAAIRSATGPSGINYAADVLLQNADPRSETAKTAVKEIREEAESARATAEEAQRSGIVPDIIRTADGFAVLDGETKETVGTAPDLSGAMQIASTHSAALDDNRAVKVAYLATLLEAGGQALEMDDRGTYSFETGTLATEAFLAAENPASIDQFRMESETREKMDGGTGAVTRVALGQHIPEVRSEVRTWTNRLFQGASVTTVFHEMFHGMWNRTRDAGTITREEALQFIQAHDTVTAGKTLRRGESLSYLPTDFEALDTAKQDSAIAEALSDIAEAEVLRSRKRDKDAKPIRVSGGIVSRNLLALAQLAPGATKKFRALIEAARGVFGLSSARALAMKKAFREGTLSEADHEAFLDRITGRDLQAEHNRTAREEFEEVTGAAFVPTENEPFSLAPATMVDSLSLNVAARVKDPKAKAAMFQRMLEKLGELKRDRDETGVAFGKSFKRKAIADPRATASIKREAAFREATRRAELEDQAHAKHSGILHGEDFSKLWNNPVWAHLAKPDDPLHGRLMSPSAATGRGKNFFDPKKQGDFDGAANIPRVAFGGNLMPDQAAQELFDAGLIKSPTPDAMWEALEREADGVAKMKDYRKAAVADVRNARLQAKEEGKAWQRERLKEEAANYSPRQRLLRSLAMLDGILAALPPAVRGKIGGYTQLAKLGTDEARLEFLNKRIERADKEVEKYLVKEFGQMMERLLERESVKANGPGKKPKGKAGADTHAIFQSIRAALKMTSEQGEAHAAALDATVASGSLTPEAEALATLESGLVRLIAGWNDHYTQSGRLDVNGRPIYTLVATGADAARRAAAVAAATNFFEAGYIHFQARKLAEREARIQRGEALKTATGSTGTAAERDARFLSDHKLRGGMKNLALSLGSFEQALHYVFGDKSAEAQRFADLERVASNRAADSKRRRFGALEDLFTDLAGGGYAGEVLRHTLGKKSVNIDGRQLSQLELITASLMWRQPDGRRHMEGHKDGNGNFTGDWHYGQAFIDAAEAALSDEAKAVRAHLAADYATEWARLNPIFRRLNGINLPRNNDYAPLTVAPLQATGGQMADPATGAIMNGTSSTPGSLRSRGTSISEPVFSDSLQTYTAHVMQIEHWLAYAELSGELSTILGNRTLGNAVEARGGKEANKVLRSWADYFAQGGARDAAAHLAINQQLGRLASNAAATALVGRFGVLVIQSTQLGAALAEVPTAAYISRLARLFAGRLGWKNAMRSEFIQRRLADMPPVVREAMMGLRAGKPNQLKYQMRKVGQLISGADALFTAGTYAICFDYQLAQARKNGLTGLEAQTYAAEAAENAVDRVAQPVRAGARSLYEVTATNPMIRLSWAFASENRQKLALSAFTLANPNASAGRKARALAVTWLAGGMVATLLRTVWRDLRDDDDDEIFDEKNWGWKRLALAATTSPLQGIPALGDLAEASIFGAAGEYLPDGNLLSAVPDAAKRVTKVPDWFTGDREAVDIARDVEAILSGMGVGWESFSAAAGISHFVADTFRFVENLDLN